MSIDGVCTEYSFEYSSWWDQHKFCSPKLNFIYLQVIIIVICCFLILLSVKVWHTQKILRIEWTIDSMKSLTTLIRDFLIHKGHQEVLLILSWASHEQYKLTSLTLFHLSVSFFCSVKKRMSRCERGKCLNAESICLHQTACIFLEIIICSQGSEMFGFYSFQVHSCNIL